jgi:NAD(P)-dependent dehydrogenase (short-subunit alcohol dehydrogenase family)
MSISLIILILIVILILYFAIGNHLLAGKCKISHDMTGKLIIITGASSGLGKFTALELVSKGAKVIFACRNEKKTRNIFNEISIENRHLAIFEKIDLSSFQSVIDFAERIKQNYEKIDILMNNAGNAPDNFKITEDGFDSCIEGNFLGHVVLTYLLIEHMNENSRIINLSSLGHNYCFFDMDMVERIYDNDYIENYFFRSLFHKNILYHITKLMMIYFTHELNEYLNKINISIKTVSLHPGVVNTEFMRFYKNNFWTNIIFTLFYPLFVLCTKTTKEGAQTQLYLSYIDYAELASGRYYADCKFEKISKTAQDNYLGREFMNYTINKICEVLPQYEKDFKQYISQ